MFTLGMAFMSTSIVLPAFVVRLSGGSDRAVGFVAAAFYVGWWWPQLLVANVLETVHRKRLFYMVAGLVRVLVLGLVLHAIMAMGTSRPTLLLIMLATLLFAFSSAGGVGMLSFYDIVGKSIPARLRGRFFGGRRLIGGSLAVAAGGAVAYMLRENSGWPFPTNYLLLFCAAFVFISVGVLLFCFVEEPAGPVRAKRLGLGEFLLEAPRILKRDVNFRRLVLLCIVAGVGMMVAPFYAAFAIKGLHVPEKTLGSFTTVQMLFLTCSNLVWAYLSDWHGNRAVLVGSAAVSIAAPVIALLTPFAAVLAHRLGGDGAWWGLAFFHLTFAAVGCSVAGVALGRMAYPLEIVPEDRRPMYLGILYTLLSPLALVPLAAGALVAWTGTYELLFVISIVSAIAAVFLALQLHEPRGHRTRVTSTDS